MTDYQSNSFKTREGQVDKDKEKEVREKKLAPVAKAKKRSLIWKLIYAFIPEDMNKYREDLFTNIIVPSLKRQIDDAIRSFIWDGKAPTSGSSSTSRSQKVNYNASWQTSAPQTVQQRRNWSGTIALDDIIVSTRSDGEAVIHALSEQIQAFGSASVADLCELCDYDSNYTDYKYGWKTLEGAEVVRVYDGYCLKLPRPIPLD